MPDRVVVVVNKWYECDPFLAALLNANGRPPGSAVAWVNPLRHPRLRTNTSAPGKEPAAGEACQQPRAVLPVGAGVMEVWCISDLLEDLPDVPAMQSSPRNKAKRVPLIFHGPKPRLVIAVGTAGFALGRSLPGAERAAGHVVIGTSVFMYDYHPERAGQDDHWDCDGYDKLLTSSLPAATFGALVEPLVGAESEVAKRFAAPPLCSASAPQVFARHELTSVGSLNVIDTNEYAEADGRALDAHAAAGGDIALPRSVETTHGLIRVSCDAPFLFVSGITNRALAVTQELRPRKFAQETTASSNAGVAVAWMLPRLTLLLTGKSDGPA